MNKINLQTYETVHASCQSGHPLTRLFSESVKFPLNFALSRQSCIDTVVLRGQWSCPITRNPYPNFLCKNIWQEWLYKETLVQGKLIWLCILRSPLQQHICVLLTEHQGKQDKQRLNKRNIKARSFNRCCSGKSIGITYYEGVSLALGI
jgi:hypothetical protein